MTKINISASYQEKDHGTPLFPFQAFSQKDDSGLYFAPYHWHQDVEFIYVTEGTLTLHTEKGAYPIEAGHVYFLNAEELHGLFGQSKTSHHYALTFHMNLLSFQAYDFCQRDFIEPILAGTMRFPDGRDLPVNINDRIGGLIEQAATAYETDAPIKMLTIKIALLRILEILYENDLFLYVDKTDHEKIKRSAFATAGYSLKEVFSYMEDHYAEKITLDDLADCMHMNKNYFCRYFKENTKKTPFAYLNEYRINKASELLLRQDASVTEIALSTGFENMSYFIRQFKRYRGATPTEFRNAALRTAAPVALRSHSVPGTFCDRSQNVPGTECDPDRVPLV